MKILKSQLQKIIAEEVRVHVKKKLVSESKRPTRTIKATPSMLRRIIAEEVAKTQDDLVQSVLYKDLPPAATMSFDPNRTLFYVMDENFVAGIPGGEISLYEKKGPSGKSFLKSTKLNKETHKSAINYLQTHDLTDLNNLKGFIKNSNQLVLFDTISTDLFVWDGRETRPLIDYTSETLDSLRAQLKQG